MRIPFNQTSILLLYAPLAIGITYLVALYRNFYGLQTRIETLLTSPNASSFYDTVAIVSAALMGFLIVALPLVKDAFSKDMANQRRAVKEYVRKGGLKDLLLFLVLTVSISVASLVCAVVSITFQIVDSLELFGLTSTLFLLSSIYLILSVYVMYGVIKATSPDTNGMRNAAVSQSISE